MERGEWIRREVKRNERQIAELQRRNRQLTRELGKDPGPPESDRIELIRAAHDAVNAERTEENIWYRAQLLRDAVEAGYSKYRLAGLLNVSRGMIYHLIDPDYNKKRNRDEKA